MRKLNTSPLAIDAAAHAAVGRAILITGAARTGTTMMGQLFQSLEDVEYIFEPPALFGLMPLIDQIAAEHWRLLYETYLFEDVLLEALAGRRLNFNTHDDSHVYRAKSEAEIAERLSQSHRRDALVAQAARSTIAYKMPDMIHLVPRLTELFPETVTIVMSRRPEPVIASVGAKGWFADDRLRNAPATWPFRRHRGFAVPFWLPEDETDAWLDAGELERGARYYVNMYETPPPASAIVIDYDAFVAEPASVFDGLARRLGRTYGPKTALLLADVAPRPAAGDPGLESVDPALIERMNAARAVWAGRAIG